MCTLELQGTWVLGSSLCVGRDCFALVAGAAQHEAISKCLRNHSVPRPMPGGLTSRVHVHQLNASVCREDSLGYLY